MEWISVKDSLPEEDLDVIVSLGETITTIGSISCVDQEWELHDSRFNEFLNVTHWMPLPDPPKENDDLSKT